MTKYHIVLKKNSAIWRDFRGGKSNGEKVKQKAKCEEEEEAKDEERKKERMIQLSVCKAKQCRAEAL